MLLVADHPVRWRRPVTPVDLRGLALVENGAIAAGVRAEALLAVDPSEAARRATHELGAITSLTVLDTLLGLPLRCPIDIADLNEREERILRGAPAGAVQFGTGHVTRVLQMPTTVVAAVVRGRRWRPAFRSASAFTPFAQRIVVLPSCPSSSVTLEAQVAGVGIWLEPEHGVLVEHLAPQPFVPMYLKAAGWRFAENAYRAAIESGAAVEASGRTGVGCACC